MERFTCKQSQQKVVPPRPFVDVLLRKLIQILTVFQLEADVVLVAIGRRPYVEGLNPAAAGVELDNKGRIIIDDQFTTSVKNIKCIGDVTFGPMLAHKAEEEG